MFAFLGHSACAYETRRGLTANFLVSFPAGSPSSEFSDTSSRTVSKRLCFGYFSLLHPSSHTEVSSFVFLTNQASLDPSCRISYLLACSYIFAPPIFGPLIAMATGMIVAMPCLLCFSRATLSLLHRTNGF